MKSIMTFGQRQWTEWMQSHRLTPMGVYPIVNGWSCCCLEGFAEWRARWAWWHKHLLKNVWWKHCWEVFNAIAHESTKRQFLSCSELEVWRGYTVWRAFTSIILSGDELPLGGEISKVWLRLSTVTATERETCEHCPESVVWGKKRYRAIAITESHFWGPPDIKENNSGPTLIPLFHYDHSDLSLLQS